MKNIHILTRLLAVVCLLAMLASVIACTKDPGEQKESDPVQEKPSDSVSDSASSSEPSEDIETYQRHNEKYPNGTEFNILWFDAQTHFKWGGTIPCDMYIEEASQNVLSYAIYSRGVYIKEQLGVQLKMEDATAPKNVLNTLKSDIANGDNMYQLATQALNEISTLYNAGYLATTQQAGLDTSYSWFDPYLTDALTIRGKTFAFASDMAFIDKLSTVPVFFNKQIVADNGFGNLYEIVNSNQWTYDKMIEMAEQITEGPGNDDTWTEDDKYGISSQNGCSYYFMHAAGLKCIETTNDGGLRYALPDEGVITILQKVYTMMSNPSIFFNRQATTGSSVTAETAIMKFTEGNALFLIRPLQALFDINQIADIEDFGIIPVPMMSDTQKRFYTPTNTYAAPVMVLPSKVTNAELTEDVIQEMSMYSRQNVRPALYEIVLGQRLVGDENASKMLDIIFDNVIYDFGLFWNLGNMRDLIVTGNTASQALNIKNSADSKTVSMGLVLDRFITSVEGYGN